MTFDSLLLALCGLLLLIGILRIARGAWTGHFKQAGEMVGRSSHPRRYLIALAFEALGLLIVVGFALLVVKEELRSSWFAVCVIAAAALIPLQGLGAASPQRRRDGKLDREVLVLFAVALALIIGAAMLILD